MLNVSVLRGISFNAMERSVHTLPTQVFQFSLQNVMEMLATMRCTKWLPSEK